MTPSDQLLLLKKFENRLRAGAPSAASTVRPLPRDGGGAKLRSSVFEPCVPTGLVEPRSPAESVVIVFFFAPMMPLSDA